jgi:tetratricopeptide (TPR) repeat protein
MIGTTLGHFKIIAKLSESRSGEVYRAEDEALRRHVVLKILSPALASDPDHKARFLQAAGAAAMVTHPHVAAVHEVGESEGRVWVATELVEGPTLRSRLIGQPLPLLDMLRIGEQVAEGLAAAHEQGLAHGDLKPEKVVLGPGGQVKVLNLGLADERLGVGDSESGMEAGRVYDTRTDVWRLGAMLYEMATGRPPETEAGAEVATAAGTISPSTLNPEIPVELARVIGACLEPDPEDRYQHTGQIAADLGKLRRRTEMAPVIVPTGEPVVERSIGRRIRRLAMWTPGILVLVAVLGLAGWRWMAPVINPGPPFRPGDRILVADFVNETGDVELGVAMRDSFEVTLVNTYLSQALTLVQRDTTNETSALDRAAAEARCLKGECEGYVSARVSGGGNRYRLEVALFRVGRSSPVIARTAQIEDGKIGYALDKMEADMGRYLNQMGVGHTNSMVVCWPWSGDANGVKADAWLVRGVFNRNNDAAESLQAFKRAVELDPTAPGLIHNLAVAYYSMGRRHEALPLFKEAWLRGQDALEGHPECREFVLWLENEYLERSWGYDAQMERLNRAIQLFPENDKFHLFLGHTTLRLLDDPARALPDFRKAFELEPNNFALPAWILLVLGRVGEVDALIDDYRHRTGLITGDRERTIAGVQLDQAYVRGDDYMTIVRMVDGFVAAGQVREDVARGWRGQMLADAGRLTEAEKILREAAKGGMTTAARAGVGESLGYDLSDWLEKRRTGSVKALTADEADFYLDNYPALIGLAQASVDLGMAHPLVELLRTAEEEHKDTQNQRVLDGFQYAHGCVALLHGRPVEAVRLLEPLAREYGPRSTLPPQHVLGRAYEAMGRWSDAARVYEAVLEKRRLYTAGPTMLGPVFVLEQYRLAGIYEHHGNPDRARHWYGLFLEDWENADPETPEVEDAKRRLAALGGPILAGT